VSLSTPLRQGLFLLALGLPAYHALAQKRGAAPAIPAQLVHADYHWDEKRRQRLPISKDEETLPAVVLKDFTALEYYFDPARKDLFLYATEHRIVRVNTTDGIEQHNKLSVPLSTSGAPVAVRARTISPRGEVVEVQPENMKELKNEDNAGGYRIFALDGVEVGSEVEYYYTRERSGSHFGREMLQTGEAIHNETFELISPQGLTFDTKVYNYPGATVQKDTTVAGKRILRLQLADVPALHKEEFAEVPAQRARIEYKLAYVANKGDARQFTWADASQFLYQMVYKTDKDDAKAVATVLKAANVPAGAPLPERIAAVEQYVKLNFNLDASASGSLPQVVATRNAPEIGFVRLMAGLYQALGITFELAVTTDRTELPFDGGFDSWGYLDKFALYFPTTKQYLAPARPDTRLGLLPAEWTANPALLVKTVKLGSTESAVGTVREVPAMPASASSHDMDVRVKFAPDLDKATVQLKQVFGGYHGQTIQAVYARVPVEKQTELVREIQKGVVPDAIFGKSEVRNGERGANALTQPFTLESTLESSSLLDKAGPRYLFKVGTLIGPQTQLYQQEARRYDVENGFNRQYVRRLAIDLPAGYAARNLPDLKMDVKTGPSATAPAYYFTSTYEQQGQQLIVNIREGYEQVYWPKKDFEAFREVVNAAANFNKVVLVLEKK
jgi:hypothetical protein